MMPPVMTPWQVTFTNGKKRLDWRVMTFGEVSAREIAERRAGLMGKEWRVVTIEPIQEAA